MDFDEHEEAEDEIGMPGYYRSLANSGRPKTNELGAACATRKHAGGGRYRECLKNHAVGIGGHAVDGCGEFMAAGEDGTLDALRCAACSCHRNFHRKELPSGADSSLLTSPLTAAAGYFHPPFSPYYRMPAGYLHHHHHVLAADQRPATLALPSTSGGGGSCREEHEDGSNMAGPSSSSAKKRHRTKFTQEQKDKMQAFAEKVGWRIKKHDEAEIDRFCNETSVKRNVFKVWMHNNKLCTLGKKLPSPPLGQLPL